MFQGPRMAPPIPGYDPVQCSAQAIYHSTLMHPDDKTLDPINFTIGSWGKLIVLGSIKRHVLGLPYNTEIDYQSLHWDSIAHEVFERTPIRLRGFMTGQNIRTYYANRMNIYGQCFPDFHLYESAVDQIIRHYSTQCLALESLHGSAANPNSSVYWETGMGQQSFATSADVNVNVTTSTNVAGGGSRDTNSQGRSNQGNPTPTVNIATSGETLVEPNKPTGVRLVRPNPKPGVQSSAPTGQTVKPYVSLSTAPNTKTGVPTAKAGAGTAATTTANVGDQLDLPITYNGNGITHIVIEHNILNSQAPMSTIPPIPRSPPRRSKRKYVEEDKLCKLNSTTTSEENLLPNPVVQKEENKRVLLSILDNIKHSEGTIRRMSEFLEDKVANGNNQLLPFTFRGMEEKIIKGEIVDIIPFLGHLRCIAILYLLSGEKNYIPEFCPLLQSLKDVDLDMMNSVELDGYLEYLYHA